MIPVRPALRGRWALDHFPPSVRLFGRIFRRAGFSWPKPGVVAQYREAVPQRSMHLVVYRNGNFMIDHLDEENPDGGRAMAHLREMVRK
jgi:hypothetical protein